MQSKINYGDTIYIQCSGQAPNNLVLYSLGFFDEDVYAGLVENSFDTSFRSAHFVVLPSFLSNNEAKAFVRALTEELHLQQEKVQPSEALSRERRASLAMIKTKSNIDPQMYQYAELEEEGLEEEEEFPLLPLLESKGTSRTKSPLKPSSKIEYISTLDYIKGEYEQKLKQTESSASRIAELNSQILKEKLGQSVKHNENILLFHVESQQFLCAMNDPHRLDYSLLKLCLSKTISRECYFQLQKLSNLGNFGEHVNYETPLTIVAYNGTRVKIGSRSLGEYCKRKNHLFLKDQYCDLNAVPEDPENKESFFPYDGYRSSFPHNTFKESFPVGITNLTETAEFFKISIYSSYYERVETQKSKEIKNGEYVRIARGKYWLTASKSNYEDRVFYEYYENDDYNHNLVQSVFQVIRLGDDAMNSSSLPLRGSIDIQQNSQTTSEPKNHGFILKHFFTGLIVADPESPHPFMDKEAQKDKKLTEFHLYGHISEPTAPLTKNSMTFIRMLPEADPAKSTFLSEGELVCSQKRKLDTDTPFFYGYKQPADYIQQFTKLSRKKAKNQPDLPSAFNFIAVTEGEIYMMNESMNFARYLKSFYLALVSSLSNHEGISATSMAQLRLKCSEYYKSLYTANSSEQLRYINIQESQRPIPKENGTVNENRQIYARECQIIDLVNKILFYLIANPKTPSVQIDQKTREIYLLGLKKLIILLTKIIQAITSHNSINHIYNGQYVRIYVLALIQPGGLYGKVATLREDLNQLKDIILPLLVKLLWDQDMDALNQINYYSKEWFDYLANQQDYSIHSLVALRHIFRSQSPGFAQTLRNSLMDDFLDDETRFRNLIPEMTLNPQNDRIYFVFRRAGQQPLEIPVEILSEARPETKYLVWVLKVICAMVLRRSLKFSAQIINYYKIDLCLRIINDPHVFYEIKNLLNYVTQLIHFSYRALPFEELSDSLLFLCENLNEVYSKISEIISQNKELLVGEDEQSMLLQRDIKTLFTQQSTRSGINFLKSLDFTLFDHAKFVVAVHIIISLMKEHHMQEIEIVELFYRVIWNILHSASQQVHNGDVSLLIQEAFDVLVKINTALVSQGTLYMINDIKSYKQLDKKDDEFQVLWVSTSEKEAVSSMIRTRIQQTLEQEFDSLKKISNQPLQDQTDRIRLVFDLLLKEKDPNTITHILRYLEEITKYKSKILSTLESYTFIDDSGTIYSVIKLTKLLLDLNRLNREISVIEEFKLKSDKIDALLDSINSLLQDIFVMVYDYESHTRSSFRQASYNRKKEVFLEYIRIEKSELNARASVILKKAVKVKWQKIMRAFDMHCLLLNLCQNLTDYRLFGEKSYDNPKIRLSVRLIMILMIIFVYKFPENQKALATYQPFIKLFHERDPNRVNLLGVDRNIAFIETIRDNEELLKMNHDYLIDISSDCFIYQIQEPFVFETQTNDPWYRSYVDALKYLFNAKLQQNLFDPEQVLLTKFKEFTTILFTRDVFSFNSLVEDQSSNLENIRLPEFHYVFEEFLKAIDSFQRGQNVEKILFLHQNLKPKVWFKILLNENLDFCFELRKQVFLIFDKIYYQREKKKGLFKNVSYIHSFIALILVDIAAYADYKAKGYDPEARNLRDLLTKQWVTDAHKGKRLKKTIENYIQIVETQPLDEIHFNAFLDSLPVLGLLTEMLDEISFDLLQRVLTEEKTTLTHIQTDLVEYISDLMFTLGNTEGLDKRVQRWVRRFSKAMVEIKEFSTWKSIFWELAKESREGDSGDKIIPRKTFAFDLDRHPLGGVIMEQVTKLMALRETYLAQGLQQLPKHCNDDSQVAEILVFFIRQSIIECPTLSEECHFAVKLLTEILKARNTNEAERQLPIFEWGELSPGSWERLRDLQNTLCDAGITNALLQMFKDNDDESVVADLLSLGTCLTYGGNRYVLDNLHSQIQSDPENEFAVILSGHILKWFSVLKTREEQRVKKLYSNCQKTFLVVFKGKTVFKEAPLENSREQVIAALNASLSDDLKVEVSQYCPILLLALKFLQSLCEGHHERFQEYVREQIFESKKHINSINFLELVKQMYNESLPLFNVYNARFGILLLELIIESIQGHTRENAYLFLVNTVLEDLTNTMLIFEKEYDLLARGFGGHASHPLYVALKHDVLVLLRDLIAGSDPIKLADIRQSINMKYLIDTLFNTIRFFLKKKGFVYNNSRMSKNIEELDDIIRTLKLDENFGPIQSVVTIYCIIKSLWGDDSKFHETFLHFAKECGYDTQHIRELTLYLKFVLEKYCVSVEITTKRTPDLVRIYFPKLTICDYLDDSEMMEAFEETVDRSNTQTKIDGLMTESKKMILSVRSKKDRPISSTVNRIFDWLLVISHIVGAVINIFIIAVFQYENDQVIEGNTVQLSILRSLIGIQLLLSFLQIIGYYLGQAQIVIPSRWTLRIQKKTEEAEEEALHLLQKTFKFQEVDRSKVTPVLEDLVLDLKGPFSEEYEILSKYSTQIVMKKTLIEVWFMASTPMLIWQLIFLGICIGAEIEPFMCAFMTINWVVRSDTVQRVWGSIANNLIPFLWTILLLTLTIYIYATIGFYFMNDQLIDDNGNLICADMFECFTNTLNLGLRNGGGIGDSIQSAVYTRDSRWAFLGEMVFELSFFIIILTLFLNVIFGMIIDSFGDLRDQKNAYDEDRKNVCFICGIDRSEFERHANFDNHTKYEHNPRNYVYYLFYILEKQKSDSINLTDIESHVLECYQSKKTDWIPIGRSLTLEQVREQEEKKKY